MKVLRGESEMILSAHQPVYLPGIILFGKIAISDVFMFLGHVQFSRTSWQTRNRVRNEIANSSSVCRCSIRAGSASP